ncbi:MAG: ATP-dependent helicase [Proteobacteria bacterium]|nr:ATP-dependent helicase [Pseudomonadota bacterium]
MPAFPIDPYIKDILIALQKPAPVLLKAEPGAGKTTRVPQALLSQFKRILVVQPRRLAAKLSAEWVAAQCQSSCGQLVGYQIRLENRSSPITRLLYVTEGVLTR